MHPKYHMGQTIVIMPLQSQQLSRDSGLGQYAGQRGLVVNSYGINTVTSKFYLYTVKTEADGQQIVLHEDEIQSDLE